MVGILRCGAVWRTVALLACMCGIQALVATSAGAVLVRAGDGHLAQFSGGVSANGASFGPASGGYGTNRKGFGAQYQGPTVADAAVGAATASANADGALAVNWRSGRNVVYGASFRLPRGFHTARQGQQMLIGWSSEPGADLGTQQGGVVIDYATNRGYLVTDTTLLGMSTQQVLAGSFRLPIGRWFTIQVRQVLASGPRARSAVYVNRRLVASSRAADFAEQRIDHVGFGIVQLSGGAEFGSVSLKLDRSFAAVYTGYHNPLARDRYVLGRTDMGVDFCMAPGEPIRALGDGVVVGISPDWFVGQPYIWYQLLDGPHAGRYVYVAEQVRKLARVGELISAGEVLARYKRSGTCIETGWSAADGATLAQATTGYHEGQVTRAGISFARFLRRLGIRGRFELRPTHGKLVPERLAAWRFQNPWTQGP